MTDLSSELGFRRNGQLRKAVYQNRALSKAGLFGAAFRASLLPASSIRRSGRTRKSTWRRWSSVEGHRVVTIASGGCNVLAYLTRSPAHIDAVDLNAAHIALNRLKLAAVQASAGAGRPLPLLRRGRQPHQLRRLRPLPRAPSRRRDPRATGRSAAGADAGASQPSTAISTAPACSACSSPPGHRVARLYGVDPARHLARRTISATSAASSRRNSRPLFDRTLIRAGAVAKVLAVRPRHSAGAVRFADHLRRRLDGERAEGAAGKARLRLPAEGQLLRLAGLWRRYPGPAKAPCPPIWTRPTTRR